MVHNSDHLFPHNPLSLNPLLFEKQHKIQSSATNGKHVLAYGRDFISAALLSNLMLLGSIG